jgi:acetyltransferase-like isoleucine patch superfamily enzyme
MPDNYLKYMISRLAFRKSSIGIVSYLQLLKMKWLGIRYGDNLRIYGKIIIIKHPASRIILGGNVFIQSDNNKYLVNLFSPTKLVTCSKTAEIVIEDNVSFNGTSIACRSTSIRIGSGTIIAGNCFIMDTDWHVVTPVDKRFGENSLPVDTDAPVNIGKNVWIGLNAVILKGVTIGDGSVIAAGSVVTRDIPSMVLAGGVPAKVIKPIHVSG